VLAALSALPDRPPSLADLLGPYFLVLTTPQVADATLQVQVRCLVRQKVWVQNGVGYAWVCCSYQQGRSEQRHAHL
jgi:hypothetical protein